jgi:hypothetical protein
MFSYINLMTVQKERELMLEGLLPRTPLWRERRTRWSWDTVRLMAPHRRRL